MCMFVYVTGKGSHTLFSFPHINIYFMYMYCNNVIYVTSNEGISDQAPIWPSYEFV